MRSSDKGATLPEVLVVSTVFFVMLAAIMAIYFSTSKAQRLISVKSDIDRELMAAVRHVDASVKSSQLLTPDDYDDDPQFVETIQLKPLKLDDDGRPSTTAEGLPEWGEPYTISFDQGQLVRVNPQRRVLAKLGGQGFVRFIRPSKEMLEMAIKVEKEGAQDYKSSRETTFQFRLFNQ